MHVYESRAFLPARFRRGGPTGGGPGRITPAHTLDHAQALRYQ